MRTPTVIAAAVIVALLAGCNPSTQAASPETTVDTTPAPLPTQTTASPVLTTTAPPTPTKLSDLALANLPKAPATVGVPVAIMNAKLTIPAPTGLPDACGSGARQFTNGQYVFHDTAEARLSIAGAIPAVVADVDGVPGNETLIVVECDNQYSVYVQQIIALKPSGSGYTTVGSVMSDSAQRFIEPETISVSNRVVSVVSGDPFHGDGGYKSSWQVRGYRYDSGHFHQVSGPVGNPSLPTSLSTVDFKNSMLALWVGPKVKNCDYCHVAEALFHNGTATTWVTDWAATAASSPTVVGAGRYQYTLTIKRTMIYEGATGQRVLILVDWSVAGRHGSAVYGVGLTGVIPDGTPLVATGTDGVTGITSIAASGGNAVVTAQTAGGTKTLRFRDGRGEPGEFTWYAVH